MGAQSLPLHAREENASSSWHSGSPFGFCLSPQSLPIHNSATSKRCICWSPMPVENKHQEDPVGQVPELACPPSGRGRMYTGVRESKQCRSRSSNTLRPCIFSIFAPTIIVECPSGSEKFFQHRHKTLASIAQPWTKMHQRASDFLTCFRG